MPKTPHILVCPLNWGLGHASRMVPIVHLYLKKQYKVTIVANGKALLFLRQEFPELNYIVLKGYNIRYFPKPFFTLGLIIQMPLFALNIIAEHYRLKRIIKKTNPQVIISDNRYGLYNKTVKSIMLTHQLFIQLPKSIAWMQKPLHYITRKLINQFNECWIPDYEDKQNSLAGDLSHGNKLPKNARYINPISRFHNLIPNNDFIAPKTFPTIIAIISGPEPHRSIFQKQIEIEYKNTLQSILIVCGNPTSINHKILFDFTLKGVQFANHLPTPLLNFYMQNATQIIARSGYSTIMDLHYLNKKAVLSPTPGQTEQEYLFKWLNQKETIKHE